MRSMEDKVWKMEERSEWAEEKENGRWTIEEKISGRKKGKKNVEKKLGWEGGLGKDKGRE